MFWIYQNTLNNIVVITCKEKGEKEEVKLLFVILTVQ